MPPQTNLGHDNIPSHLSDISWNGRNRNPVRLRQR
jgi:hypothetical protein